MIFFTISLERSFPDLNLSHKISVAGPFAGLDHGPEDGELGGVVAVSNPGVEKSLG